MKDGDWLVRKYRNRQATSGALPHALDLPYLLYISMLENRTVNPKVLDTAYPIDRYTFRDIRRN